MPFVNSYAFSNAARFRKLVPALDQHVDGAKLPGDMLAIGSEGTMALVARIRADGTVVWSMAYSFAEFVDGVAAAQDEFVLLARVGDEATAAGIPANVLMRIGGQGNVLWASEVKEGGDFGRVLRLEGLTEEFLVVAGAPRTPASYGIYVADLVRFGANGTRLGSAQLMVQGGGRIFDAAAVADGYILVGDGGMSLTLAQWIQNDPVVDFETLGQAGLIVKLDPELTSCTCNLLRSIKGETSILSLRAISVTAPDTFVVAGAIGDSTGTVKALAATFTGSADSTYTYTYDLDVAYTRPVGIDNFSGHPVVLIAHRPDALAAQTQVLRLNSALVPQARHGFDFAGETQLFELRVHNGEAAIPGALSAPMQGAALILSLDETFECCRTHDLPLPDYRPSDLLTFMAVTECEVVPTEGESLPMGSDWLVTPATVASACGTVAVELSEPRLVQSPYLNLQAAGSDGTDASRGVLLRWLFAGALANHLPKGTQAQNTFGFNKPDDFVTIYRAEWPANASARRLSFATDRPHHVDDAARTFYFLTGTSSDLFAVQFSDAAAYATAKQTADPFTNPAGFLAAYGARPFEVELRNVLAIACDLSFQTSVGGTLKVETRSVGENRPLAAKQVTSRRILGAADGPVARLFAENIRSVRLQTSATQLQSVAFACYDDVLTDVNARKAWTEIGRFALSVDEPEVFRRLEDPGRFVVNGLWRKYDVAAPVNVANYRARWSEPSTGVGAAVQSYLQLSATDPTATVQFAGAFPEDASIGASYLDLLQIVATDFHIARMFGLGHVDSAVQPAISYIHLAEYRTLGDLDDGHGARAMQHLYLSLPTTLDRYRLPFVPDLDGIDYGLTVPTGSGMPYQLTDAQGYTPDGTARFIKLYPGCRPLYALEQGFFDPPDLFDLSAASLPMLYGVEYRGAGENAWRRPTIAHDDDFLDAGSPPLPEILTTPFPATQRASAFIHKETEAGIHEYAVYAVNLFSRASPLCPARATDTTVFKPRNTLLPPSDLQVQFIQIESTPVLTTANEQVMLANQGASDATLVRLCCNYGMAQDTAYGFADTIEILHRRQVPGNVTGGVAAVGDASDPALLRIETTAYTFSSTQQTVYPILPAAMKANFVGGALVAGGTRLTIEDIQWPNLATGANPIFLVRKPTTTGVVHDAGANTMLIQDAPPAIYPGDLVMAVENMAAAANWGAGNPLTTTIQIGDSTWTTRTESFIRSDGTSVTRKLRGAWDTARIDPDPDDPKQYEIAFDNYILKLHPQAGTSDPINWWKGTVRVPVVGRDPEDRRNLVVIQILAFDPNKLVLLALDDSGEPDDIVTGSGQWVNYYPGYKLYLHADAANAFDYANLTPAPGEGARTTLLGLRSRDSSTLDGANQPYRSAMGVPQLLAATEIREPKQPRKPKGLKYAPPPDAYGKSGYTLTVDFDNEPFSVAFYRADALSILDALYDGDGENSSLAKIRAAILPPESDPYFTDRFEDLFAFLEDGRAAPSAFPDPDGFALPVPDETALNLPGGPLTLADKPGIKAAVLNVFVPLTEQPLIYSLVRTDPAYVPTNRPQKFRGASGSLLMPNDPAFDLSPMAKRPGSNSIQFVDFTLDGSMNPNTVYFYFAREISNRMQFGEASPIFGPIKLVNLTAPAAPKLRKMVVVPFDPASGARPRVEFEVIAPAAIDPMARVRIYRASAAVDALSVRTMRVIADIDLSTLTETAEGTLIVADDFSNDPFVPYGDPLFYRLVWIREVKYEDANQVAQQADVVSEPTRTFLANVIDVTNPPPPFPAFTVLSTATNGDKFLRATWSKTVHNGTYYLSRLSPMGNWTRIGTLKTNDPAPVFDLPGALPVNDDDTNPIYYRFKIDVEGSAGLLNTYDAPVTARLDLLG